MLPMSLLAASGAVAAFDPLTLSPALWLDASDAASITSSGGAVSQWSDKSGNAHHATQSVAASKPTTGANTQNGLNVLTFDGVDDYLTITNFMSAWTAGELLAVIKVDADPPATATPTGIYLFNEPGSAAASHHPWTDGNIYDRFGSTARKSAGNPTPSLASWHL